MQLVNARPAQLAAAHALHGRLVARAPGQSQRIGINLRIERLHFTHNAAMPVHHGAEDVEGQNLEGVGVWRCGLCAGHGVSWCGLEQSGFLSG